MTEFGRLDVFIDGESRFSQHTLPYTVRDSHLAAIHEGKVGDEPLELNRGVYSIDLLTHTGLPATSVVMITPDVTTHIRIAPDGNVAVITGDLSTSRVREIFTSNDLPFGGDGLEIVGLPHFELAAGSTTTPTLEVADTSNCEIRAILPSGAIVIEPTEAYPKDVPAALFRLGEDFVNLSLPLNPSGTRPELRACIVTAVRDHGKDRVRVSFPAARELCVMMDGLLRSNSASSAIEIFEAATHLMEGDDLDPAGAVLGGLTLHRLGRLSQPEGWVEKLATNYAWLPDGQILWAAQLMLSSRARDRESGLNLLLSATQRRPLYSDGLALAMELLRRWPHAEHREARTERLGFLAARWSETDWDATSLTLVPPLVELERADNMTVATRIVSSTEAPETDSPSATPANRDIGPVDRLDSAPEAVLSRAGIFQGVDTEAVSALHAQLQPVQFPARHTVFTEGEPGDRLFIIVSGKVAIGRRSADGREHLLAIMGASDMFGELAIFDPGPRTATATTITEVDAVSMDSEALRAWIADRPEIAEQLLRVLARRLRRTDNNLADLIFTDVPGRVAKQLLTLAGRFGTRQGGALRVTHDLTQEEIAQLVGASRETVNKALAEFAQRGWIRLEGKSVVISNIERLNNRAR